MNISNGTNFEVRNERPRKIGEVPRKELEKPRNKMLSEFGSAGLKIEAQKTRHPQKSDEDPFEISKNPPRICDQKKISTPKIRVSKKNGPG